ncbi:MAG: peptidyl-prolyl cis-trans isomerase [Candidatus Omnitrophota bacterium]|nr:peptidyl-prolyl cis-trans isomerase [Candidatus Omnitrophota bacterium]MDZ4243156.1 peptidyl-prolyl cis-trans isomerase [Candidatus Omnitrophota bacterium]
MKRIPKVLMVVSLMTLAAAGPAVPPAGAVEDGILAVVNDDIITLRDLREYLDSYYYQLKSEGQSEEDIQKAMKEIRDNAINRLIEDRLILTEASRKGVQVREEAIQKKMADIEKQYPSKEVFLNALLTDGNNVTDLRNKIIEQMKIKFLVDDQVRNKIYVNPQEVTAYYTANIDTYKKAERVDLDSIFIKAGEPADDARQKAEEALGLLKEGKDFADVAKQFSQASSVGIMAKGQMLPQIEEAVLPLKAGEVSPVIEAGGGFYIFKVKNKLPAETAPLEEVKESIYNMIFSKKYRERLRSWIDGLKKTAYVEIKER